MPSEQSDPDALAAEPPSAAAEDRPEQGQPGSPPPEDERPPSSRRDNRSLGQPDESSGNQPDHPSSNRPGGPPPTRPDLPTWTPPDQSTWTGPEQPTWTRLDDSDLTQADRARASPAAPVGFDQPPPLRRRRRWPVVAGIAAGLLALVAGAGWYALGGGGENTPDRSVPPRGGAASAPADPAAAATAGARRQLDALIEKRGRAVTEHDLTAFLAGLEPSDRRLVAHERQVFNNLEALPVTAHRFEVRYANPPRPFDAANPNGDWSPGTVDVAEYVQLREVDAHLAESDYTWALDVRAGKLLITKITPKSNGGFAPAPWDTATLTVVRTKHMLVAATPDAARRAREIADAAEAAYAHSKQFWPEKTATEFAIFATAKTSTFDRWFGTDEAGNGEAVAEAITVPACCDQGPRVGDVTDVRITIDTSQHPERIDLEWTLAHELTHAVAEPFAAADVDDVLWADEGYAEWVGVQMLDYRGYFTDWAEVARKAAHRETFNGKLPPNDRFYGKHSDENYALSERFFEYAASHFGTAKTRAFYFYLNAMKRPDPDAAMRKYFDTSERKLLAAWSDWVA